MSTAQSENVVTLPATLTFSVRAAVFKALGEFTKNNGNRERLDYIWLHGGALYASNGHYAMRYRLDGLPFEAGCAVKPDAKLPAGAESVTVAFNPADPWEPATVAVQCKGAGAMQFEAERSGLDFMPMDKLFSDAERADAVPLAEGYAYRAAYLAFLGKNADAVQRQTIGVKGAAIWPHVTSASTLFRCADENLAFLLMPMRR